MRWWITCSLGSERFTCLLRARQELNPAQIEVILDIESYAHIETYAHIESGAHIESCADIRSYAHFESCADIDCPP